MIQFYPTGGYPLTGDDLVEHHFNKFWKSLCEQFVKDSDNKNLKTLEVCGKTQVYDKSIQQIVEGPSTVDCWQLVYDYINSIN